MEENAYIHVNEETLKRIDEKMPPEEELLDLAEFFKVFGDGTRLKILYVLLSSEMCVYDIAAVLGMSQSAISHQLRVLKQMDLVKNRRDGKCLSAGVWFKFPKISLYFLEKKCYCKPIGKALMGRVPCGNPQRGRLRRMPYGVSRPGGKHGKTAPERL